MVDFSERMGIKVPSADVQADSMDESMRNGLWTAFLAFFTERISGNMDPLSAHAMMEAWITLVCTEFFRMARDQISPSATTAVKAVRKRFYELEWNDVYEFVEFVASSSENAQFTQECNRVFERDRSAYRFAGNHLVRITEEHELAAVQAALGDTSVDMLRHVQTHLQAAIRLMSVRENPDYRNSIKESVSAVEGAVNVMVGGKKGALGKALKKIDPPLHPALAEGLSKIYGWTSDGGGIRHALMDESIVELEDAQLMLVMCSGFVSFLVAKAARAGAI